jgi:pimeloyl-ACP methyl ester carboxylesterase
LSIILIKFKILSLERCRTEEKSRKFLLGGIIKVFATMSNFPSILWLSTSPSWQRFEQPLIRYLSDRLPIAQWEYCQSQDEPSSLDVAQILLYDYLKYSSQPVHLIGHSTGGLLGLLFARKYPERVKSLTLLAVGVHPAVDWQSHYYTMRQLLPINREKLLSQMVDTLFGHQDSITNKHLAKALERDLSYSPSPHSLFRRVSEPTGGVSMPLMVCGSKDDFIIDSNALQGWRNWFKEGDRLWECPEGRHFFHYFYPKLVGKEIFDFWKSLSKEKVGV